MAHRDKFVTARIEQADALYYNHEATGLHLRLADVLDHNGKKWIVLREGGTFHLRVAEEYEADDDGNTGYGFYEHPYYGEIYRPINQAMTYEDVEGATFAHDTGTDWLFAHCSPQQQIDFAARARTFAIDQFMLLISKADMKVIEATNAVVKSQAAIKAKAVTRFAEAVGEEVHKQVVGATLGHFHRNPHEDHKRDLTVAAIDAVLAAWAEAGKTDKAAKGDHAAVTTPAATVRSALTTTHTIEWRHARVARLAAEKKAAEAAAEAESETSTQTPAEGDGA